MKTKEEIEQLAEKNFPIEEYPTCEGFEHFAYKQGYTQCQNDMADKKYTEEDLMNAFNAGINNDYGNGPSFDKWLNSLNKQD
jgi:hypothetical protein